ncbi:hypothetical protein N7522_006375 [Penicillium canescens]|nr:hypothetical protein N7522_006375 [Penicillium canescens]
MPEEKINRPQVCTAVARPPSAAARDLGEKGSLWTTVNGFRILMAYRQPTTPKVFDHVTNQDPKARRWGLQRLAQQFGTRNPEHP